MLLDKLSKLQAAMIENVSKNDLRSCKSKTWLFLFILIAFMFIIFGVKVLILYNVQQLDIEANMLQGTEQQNITKLRHVFSQMIPVEATIEGLRKSVNIHYWDYTCGHSVEAFRAHPLFPFFPFRREIGSSLNIQLENVFFGARIFGYLHPDQTGYYQFAISSDDSSEFWLSPNEDPLNVQLFASVGGKSGIEWAFIDQFDKYQDQLSDALYLLSGKKYYFEILWKQAIGRSHMHIVWKKPNSEGFEEISTDFLSRYYEDDLLQDGLVYADHLKTHITMQDLPCHVTQVQRDSYYKLKDRKTPYQRDSVEFLRLPLVSFSDISHVLPTCKYKPTYLIYSKSDRAQLREGQYGAVHLPHYYNISTRVYPPDGTRNMSSNCIGSDSLKPMHCFGNFDLNENTAKDVAEKFMLALEKKFPGRYFLHTIVNIEENSDDENGKRYFIEAALEDKLRGRHVRLSVYVYQPTGSENICFPENFQWNPDAMVYLILTVKDQGPWVCKYIESLSRIYHYTKDNRFTLIIADFNSYDLNIEEILRINKLPNWKVIKMNGKFHKTIAIQEAVESIDDPNGIILQTDLHLEFPMNFIDDNRKHCVQGKMGYTPLLMRLACGRFLHSPAGFWEAFGYGIFGLYKSDWDTFQGMDVEKFRNAWGGEDWDFAERVIKSGLEIERLRVPYFFHYFHTKEGMWDGKATA